jgi:hypothetical protein
MKFHVHLRPHHLVCLLSFQGRGYNDVFVAETGNIVEIMKAEPKKKLVRVVSGCDDVCEYCPKNNNNLCENELMVSNLDAFFFKKLNFFEGNIMSFEEINAKVKTLSAGDFFDICFGCRWFDICRKNLNIHCQWSKASIVRNL